MKQKHISFSISPVFIKESDKVVTLGYRKIRLREFQYRLYKRLKYVGKKELIILSAPTGAGKTLSLLIPLFINIEKGLPYYHGVIGIYPSKELAKDQMISVANLLDELVGPNSRIDDIADIFSKLVSDSELRKKLSNLSSDKEVSKLCEYLKCWIIKINSISYPIILILLTSESLNMLRDALFNAGLVKRNRNIDVIKFLSEAVVANGYRIIFTVPEYPYLLAQDIYKDFHSAGVWLHAATKPLVDLLRILSLDNVTEGKSKLRLWFKNLINDIGRHHIFRTFFTTREEVSEFRRTYLLLKAPIFFDEFHLYSGFSLASFIALLFIYLKENVKIVISSATPKKVIAVKGGKKDLFELVEELCRVFGYDVEKVSEVGYAESKNGYVQIRKKTLVKVISVTSRLSGPKAFGYIQRGVPSIVSSDEWKNDFRSLGKAMIILDRIASVIETGFKLYEELKIRPVAVTSVKVLLPEPLLSPKDINLREARLIVGNMSIAFGLDIKDMRLGLIVAKDPLSAIQKIGRIGRGKGDDLSIVYIPLPDFAYAKLSNLIKKELTYNEFIRLLGRIYPKEPIEILVRWRIGIAKVLVPTWVYVIANIIAERDTIREWLMKEDVRGARHLREYIGLVEVLRSFIGHKDLPKAVAKYLKYYVNLPPIAMYSLYSFRASARAPVKLIKEGKELTEELDFVSAGRNFTLTIEEGKIYLNNRDLGRGYAYTNLWLGVLGKTDLVKDAIKRLKWKVCLLSLLGDVLNLQAVPINLYQGMSYKGPRTVCTLKHLIENAEWLHNIPILILPGLTKRGEMKDLIEYLSATSSVIPIYTVKIRHREYADELLGALYVL